MSIETTIQAHLDQVSPNTPHTIRGLDWRFAEMVGAVSTEHTRRSLQRFWLVDADRSVILEPIAATVTLKQHDFAQRAAEHSPEQWAELALCSLQQSGRSLVEQIDMSALNRHWELEDVAPPQLTSGPTLEFWTTSEYRGVDAFYQHTVSVKLGGKLTHKVSKERRFKRK